MVQIIQSGPSAQTLRQQAFQQGLDQIGQSLNAWANLSEQRTQREQALNEKKNQNALELIKARIAAGEELTPQEEAFVNSNMPQQLVAQSPQAIQSEQPASEDVQGAIGKLFAQQTQSAANPETKYDEAGNIIGSKFPISETAKEISKKSALNQAGYYDPSNGRLQYDSTGLLISPYDPKKRLDQQPQQETQQTSQGRKLTPRKQAEVDKIKAQTAIDTYKAKQYELPIEQRDEYKVALANSGIKAGAEKERAIDEIRKEISVLPITKSMAEINTAYSKIKTAAKTPAGDMSLVFALMKLYDPTSTVREGEYAKAEQTRGVPDSIRAMYNKAQSGQMLTEEQRNDFKNVAKGLFESQTQSYKAYTAPHRARVKQLGLDEKLIFPSFSEDVSNLSREEKIKALQAKDAGGV